MTKKDVRAMMMKSIEHAKDGKQKDLGAGAVFIGKRTNIQGAGFLKHLVRIRYSLERLINFTNLISCMLLGISLNLDFDG